MNLRNILVPVLVIGLLLAGYRAYGWAGVAGVGGGVMMWLLLHFTRLMNVLKKAADHPIGYVSSAVMLNARLQPRMALMQVIALTRSLGQLQSPANTQPEIYRWIDASGAQVDCEFHYGKLAQWQLQRPVASDVGADAAAPATTP